MTDIATDPPQDTVPAADPPLEKPASLYSEPAKIAAFIKSRKAEKSQTTGDGQAQSPTPPYDFADFVTDMEMTDFEDIYEIRAMLESQAHILGSAFHYLMLEGDWKNLAFILRTQKVMRDTMAMMNSYPALYHAPDKGKYRSGQIGNNDAAHLDTI